MGTSVPGTTQVLLYHYIPPTSTYQPDQENILGEKKHLEGLMNS